MLYIRKGAVPPREYSSFCNYSVVAVVLTGEVQIDIRLLISFESKEGFKWDIVSLFDQWMTASRAVTIRHITSRHTGI